MKALSRLLCAAAVASAFACACPAEAYADNCYNRYSQVSSYVRRGENAMSSAKNYRRQADSYRRDADRYLRDAERYHRAGNVDRAHDYQRRAERAMDKAGDYTRRADRSEAEAASFFRRAANLVESR